MKQIFDSIKFFSLTLQHRKKLPNEVHELLNKLNSMNKTCSWWGSLTLKTGESQESTVVMRTERVPKMSTTDEKSVISKIAGKSTASYNLKVYKFYIK